MVELVDTQVSGTCGATRGGSSPLLGTNYIIKQFLPLALFAWGAS